MTLVLVGLMVYAMVCMAYTMRMMLQGFDELMASVPPGTRFVTFIGGIIFVVLISPVQIPLVVAKVLRQTWREAMDQCQSSDEDRQ